MTHSGAVYAAALFHVVAEERMVEACLCSQECRGRWTMHFDGASAQYLASGLHLLHTEFAVGSIGYLMVFAGDREHITGMRWRDAMLLEEREVVEP